MDAVTGYGATDGVVIEGEIREIQMNVMKLVLIGAGNNRNWCVIGIFLVHLEVPATSFELECFFVFAVEGTAVETALKI